MSTITHSHFKRQAWLGACGMAALLALSACGGGGGDDNPPAPAEARASDCLGPLQMHHRGVYRISGNYPGTLQIDRTDGTRTDLNGRQVLLDTVIKQASYTAPANYAGHTLTEVTMQYYTHGADSIETVYADAYASHWEDWAVGEQNVYADAFDPPYADPIFTLKPGQSVVLNIKGVRHGRWHDGTVVDEPIDSRTTRTYHGQEQVEVPAGRFTACKFSDTSTDGTPIMTWWRAKDTGIEVKSIAPEEFEGGAAKGQTRTLELTEYQLL